MKLIPVSLVFLILLSCTPSETKQEKVSSIRSRISFSDQLIGNWSAPAFDGRLAENWSVGDDGWLVQQAYYIEDGDTSYQAQSKIEKVGGKYILFSVVDEGNSFIFQSTHTSSDSIVFENEESIGTIKVVYKFLNPSKYSRAIHYHHNGEMVSSTFDFSQIN